MDEILTQEEVNALLNGISEGSIDTDKVTGEGSCEPYSFPQADESDTVDIASFEEVMKTLSEKISESLTVALRRIVETHEIQMDVVSFQDFLAALPDIFTVSVFKIDPPGGLCLLAIDGEMIFNLIELFFGGTGSSKYTPVDRGFTPLELKVIGTVRQMILEDMEKAWQTFFPARVETVKSNVDPKSVPFFGSDQKVLKIALSSENDFLRSKILICIPITDVEPMLEMISPGFDGHPGVERTGWGETLEKLLFEMALNVTGEVGKVRVTILESLRMNIGDLLVIDRSIDDDIPLLVEGVPKFKGKLGICRGKYSVKIKKDVP